MVYFGKIWAQAGEQWERIQNSLIGWKLMRVKCTIAVKRSYGTPDAIDIEAVVVAQRRAEHSGVLLRVEPRGIDHDAPPAQRAQRECAHLPRLIGQQLFEYPALD